MRYWGFDDATTTERGADGGVDVRASRAIAQVKAHQVPIGRPDLQRLHGVAVTERKLSLFFSLMYYTPQASEWADGVGMALFRFNYACEPEPMNDAARVIVADAPEFASSSEGTDGVDQGLPHAVPDGSALLALDRERRGGLSGRETIVGVCAAWLLVYVLRLETEHREGVRRIARHHTSYTALDSFAAAPVSPQIRDAPHVDIARGCLFGAMSEEAVSQRIYGTWHRARRETGRVEKLKKSAELRRLGVPLNADSLAVFVDDDVMYPVFVGCFERRGGRRLAVVDGLTSVVRRDWSDAITRELPDIEPTLAASRQLSAPPL
jgi:hypothetical protein